MPYATLRFKLPEEQDEFQQVQMAGKYASALHDYYQWIRSKHKHGDGDEATRRAFSQCFDEFMRVCRERGFDPLSGLP